MTDPIDETAQVQDPCFWCRRGMHDSCNSGLTPCRCCASLEWVCQAHDVLTTGDCSKCDDEEIAALEMADRG